MNSSRALSDMVLEEYSRSNAQRFQATPLRRRAASTFYLLECFFLGHSSQNPPVMPTWRGLMLHFNRFGDSGRVSLPVHEGSVLPTAETSREAYRVGSRARVPPPGSALLQQLASQPRPRPPEGGEAGRLGEAAASPARPGAGGAPHPPATQPPRRPGRRTAGGRRRRRRHPQAFPGGGSSCSSGARGGEAACKKSKYCKTTML
ncbi:uncharacterized protein [Equus przewalskii]|uniref:Uncharacterized protein n=1 Tax=Equus przewalskii TaxID=9798 RepID=A0ABM4L067_EQUPR